MAVKDGDQATMPWQVRNDAAIGANRDDPVRRGRWRRWDRDFGRFDRGSKRPYQQHHERIKPVSHCAALALTLGKQAFSGVDFWLLHSFLVLILVLFPGLCGSFALVESIAA